MSEHQDVGGRRDIDSLLNWGASPSGTANTGPREIHQPDPGTPDTGPRDSHRSDADAPESFASAGASEAPRFDASVTSASEEAARTPDSVILGPDQPAENHVSQLQTVDSVSFQEPREDPFASAPPTDETAKIEIIPGTPNGSEPDASEPGEEGSSAPEADASESGEEESGNSEPGEINGSLPPASGDSDTPEEEIYPEDLEGDVTEDPEPPDPQPDTSAPEDTGETEDPEGSEGPGEIITPNDPDAEEPEPSDPEDQTGQPDAPDESETPDPEDPNAPKEPEDPKDPNAPKEPEDPKDPEEPETPDLEDPNAPEEPETPDLEDPNAPEEPETPDLGIPGTGASSGPEDTGQAGTELPSSSGMPSGGGGVPDPSAGNSDQLAQAQAEKEAAAKAEKEAAAKIAKEAKDRAAKQREESLTTGDVSGDWRKAEPSTMEKLGSEIKAVAGEGGEADRAHTTAKGIGMSFPGFGVLGLTGLTSAHESTRDNAARYIEATKTQLASWNDQLVQGAAVIKAANQASTIKEP